MGLRGGTGSRVGGGRLLPPSHLARRKNYRVAARLEFRTATALGSFAFALTPVGGLYRGAVVWYGQRRFSPGAISRRAAARSFGDTRKPAIYAGNRHG